MTIDPKALLALFPNLDDIPACDEGMELARRFLESCGNAVLLDGGDDHIDRALRFIARWNEYVEHRASCPKCNEE